MKTEKRLSRLTKMFPGALSGAFVSAVISAFMMILQALFISRILNDIFLLHKDLASVGKDLGLLLIASLVRSVFVWLGKVQSDTLSIGIRKRLRLTLFKALLQAGPFSLRTQDAGRLSSTLMEGVEALHGYFSLYLPQIVLAVLLPVIILVFIFPADLISGAVLLVTAPIIPLFMVLIGNRADRKSRAQWLSLNLMSAHFLDILRGLTTLKIFGRADEQTAHIERVSNQFRTTTMGVLKTAFLSALVLEMAAMISTAVIAVEVGLRLLYHQMAFQQAIFILILAPEFYQPLRQLGAAYHAGISGIAAADSIFPILDDIPAQHWHSSLKPESDGESVLTCEQLSFRYDQPQPPVLKNLNFSIARGETLFIIGPSGSGKSTLFNLLLKFVQPENGHIRFEGCDISEINTAQWRDQLIWVPQKSYLLHRSIEDNLRFANPLSRNKELHEACRKAELHSFITSLPDGYRTMIHEQGTRLSAGQARRMSLARAFLKTGRILLLDEPTSSLDTETEQTVWQNIRRFTEGRILLVITHHLHLIRPEDRILLLVNGAVVQSGRHGELRKTSGLYRDLCGQGGSGT